MVIIVYAVAQGGCMQLTSELSADSSAEDLMEVIWKYRPSVRDRMYAPGVHCRVCLDGRVDARIDGRMDGRVDGRMDERTYG